MPFGVRGRYKPRSTIAEKLAAKGQLQPYGCIVWTGYRDPYGYGIFSLGGVVRRAHREAWALANGPIPASMCVCHTCDNPPCINPDHLFLGTRDDNNKDKAAKGRHPRGAAHPNTKLPDALIDQIRSDPRHQGIIAAELGVNQSTISRIRRRERRFHI